MTSEKTEQLGKERKCGRTHLKGIERMFREGSIIGRAEAYVNECLKSEQEGERALFPNLAGFGRELGIGLGELHRLGEKFPAVYDAILAVLEDGALNTERIPGKSALLAMTYFRRRLGYEPPKAQSREDNAKHAENAKQVRVVFGHDIGEDGK